MIDEESKAYFKIIIDLLGELKKVGDRHEGNTDKEIGDLHDFTLKLAEVSGKIDAVHSGQKRVAERTADSVEDATQPLKDETEKLKKAIKEKKVITLKIKPKWFGFLRR